MELAIFVDELVFQAYDCKSRECHCHCNKISKVFAVLVIAVSTSSVACVFFFFLPTTDRKSDRRSEAVLSALENIDDDCDRLGIVFVKVDDPEASRDFGFADDNAVPSLVYFENKIPHLYQGTTIRCEKWHSRRGPIYGQLTEFGSVLMKID